MHTGWIKIHRKLLSWEWYDDINTKCLFFHLLLKCNHTQKKWRGIVINPGEIIIGIEEFGRQIGLTRQQARTAFSKLKSTNEITIKTSNSFTLIKLNNWGSYQENNQQDNQRITNEQPTDNQRITTTKECKNERMKELYIDEQKVLSTPESEMKKFIEDSISETEDFIILVDGLSKQNNVSEIGIKEEIKRFVSYWTEPTKNGKKTRWQLQQTFDVRRRLSTWLSRADFSKYSITSF